MMWTRGGTWERQRGRTESEKERLERRWRGGGNGGLGNALCSVCVQCVCVCVCVCVQCVWMYIHSPAAITYPNTQINLLLLPLFLHPLLPPQVLDVHGERGEVSKGHRRHVIKYFSLFSVYVQCEVFAILTFYYYSWAPQGRLRT